MVGSHPKGTGAMQVFEMSQKELKVTKSVSLKIISIASCVIHVIFYFQIICNSFIEMRI